MEETSKKAGFSILQWMLSFVGIILVRLFFESLSNPTPNGVISSDAYNLVHVNLFFLVITLGTILIVGKFTQDYKQASNNILFFLPIIWLAPILDIVLSGGRGYIMFYFFDSGKNLLSDALKFFSPSFMHGVTYGMRISYVVLISCLGLYVWKKNKKIWPTIFATILLFVFMFIIGSLPSSIYMLNNPGISNPTSSDIINTLDRMIASSNIPHNTLHEGPQSVVPLRFIDIAFNKFMSQILFIISFLFSTIFFLTTERRKTLAVIKNCRPERIIYYLVPMLLAMAYTYDVGLGKYNSFIDSLGLISLFISWFGMWMFSVHLNDIADINIDKITNRNRPLVENKLDLLEMNQSSYLFLMIALVGSWVAGFYQFYMVTIGLAIAYIYSMPPLRLKRFPIVSTFLMSTVIVCAAISGFFFVSVDKNLHLFSPLIILGILATFTFQLNFKDLKDVEGDKKDGVLTIPVIFTRYGKKIVGLLFALSFLLVPYFLSFSTLYIVAVPFAVLGYYFVNKEPYNEKRLFILNFLFVLSIILVIYLLFLVSKHI